jgi:cell division transport system ATP-binding protein
MIIFRKVSKLYPPDTYALKDVSFHIRPGEFVSIVGRSGTGKTTVVKLLTSEEKATSGKVIVGGWDITTIKHREVPLLRRQIGVVYQDFKLLAKKTVYENIAFALQACGTSRQRVRAIVPQVIKIVGLEGKENRYPIQLSGGEQQRVAIARSLVHRPKILIADEPTGNLDQINTKEIIELLLKINEFGTTVLLVTHNSDVVDDLGRRVIVLDNGELVSDQKVGKYMIS